MLRSSFLVTFALLSPALAAAQERKGLKLTQVPIRVPVQWPKDLDPPLVVAVEVDGMHSVGQLTEPSYRNETVAAEPGKVRKDLVIIAAKVSPGQAPQVRLLGADKRLKPAGAFAWKEQAGAWDEVAFVDGYKSTPVMRYMHKAYTPNDKDMRKRTYKVFHHLYNPAGTRFVTNGGHTDAYTSEQELTFPHHRGLMFGFNKCSYDGKSADTWHCTGDAHVSHQKTLFKTAGPIMTEHRVLLSWHGPKNEVFAEEERQMTVYRVTGGTLVEFATRLRPKVNKVHLDGDPQHAGFQFRAANDVAKKTARQTYYLRPDGKGELGATRNWPGDKAKTTNLPWDVLSFVLDGKRYSVEYIDHPDNPGEKRYSERDYGRFGCYFSFDLTPEQPLLLNHRIWLQEGEMTVADAEAQRAAFVAVPRGSVKQ